MKIELKDYASSAVVAGLTVVVTLILFSIARVFISFILDHWLLMLLCIFIGIGAGLFFLVRD
jgi:hypothetical protein